MFLISTELHIPSKEKKRRQEGQKRRVSEFMEARGIGGEQP